MKWLSRKFLYPIIYGIIALVNAKLLNNALPDNVMTGIAYLIIAFILGKSVADIISRWKFTPPED